MVHEESSIVLAIISDQSIVENLADLLEGTTFTLKVVSDSVSALQIAEELLPDVIILDMDPDGHALGTCRQLRSNRVLQGMPILVVLDNQDRDLRALGLSAGADDFILKPFDDIELLSRLRTITRLNAKRMMVTDLTRFTWMASHAADGYVLLDESGNIHYANENAHILLNLPEEYLGLPFVAVVEHRFKPEPEEAWANWNSEPVPLFLVQPESPTARANWVMVDALDTSLGIEFHRVVRLKDVTERMSLYQDMRRFHTVVAHKLRTPVSMLASSISLLNSRLDQLSVDEVKELVRSSIKGVDRMTAHVQEIVKYIDAPMALNEGEPITLEQTSILVGEICAHYNLNRVVISLSEHLASLTLALTKNAMEMILFELLENAQKFHPENNPTVEISFGEVDNDYVRLRVSDDGQSLSIEQLSWAWLPYLQGEKDFTGELPGIGLGFPMVATLVWKAGGELWLRNRHDSPGVIVELKLPLESAARKFERPAAPYQG